MNALPPYVLVVEASDAVREPLERRLAERGHRVEAAAAPAGERRPDAIVLGLGALDALRGRDELAAVPLIVLAHDRDALLDALQRGAHDGVVAPFDVAELEARVLAALRVTARHDGLVEANLRLAEQALTDDLTGLANRRHGERQLEREVALAVRKGHDLGVLRVDVDHFKAINDVHGHQAGDRVLAEVARRLSDAVRGGDLLARWGGDEFVAILPATERAGVLRAAERLRASVASQPVRVNAAAEPVTISVGWAHWAGDTPGDLLARADRALYAAKDAGRDTVRPT
ncbi:MAG TPA: diguanylate cyclase [Solirubrobacteraceae bacterium]|nr:diguanylate cyclase [Solirubrobacteraceae bacterium]